jgi:hypothetical protein
MVNFRLLTFKLLKAIRIKYGQNLLYAEEQKVSENTGKVYTEYRVSLSVTVEKYNEMHPEAKLSPKIWKSKYCSILLKRTVRIEELFMYLLETIWKKLESGEMYEDGERARERVRSRYGAGESKGRGRRKKVLRDKEVSEELSGGVSGDKQCGSGEEGQGDIGEA